MGSRPAPLPSLSRAAPPGLEEFSQAHLPAGGLWFFTFTSLGAGTGHRWTGCDLGPWPGRVGGTGGRGEI